MNDFDLTEFYGDVEVVEQQTEIKLADTMSS